MLIVPNKINEFARTTNLQNDPNIPTWDTNETYAAGDMAIYGNYVYSSLADSNTGNNPAENTLKWFLERPTNQYAMFDAFNDTKSVSTSTIVADIQASFVDYIALFGLHASSVRIRVDDGESVQLDETYATVAYSITDWWENMYDEGVPSPKILLKAVPTETQNIRIDIEPYLGKAECGNMLVGLSQYAGCTLADAKISVRSTTKRDRRGDGRIVAKKGIAYDRISVPVIVDTNMLDTAIARFRAVDAVPTLFVADDREKAVSALSVYGFFKDFEMDFGITKTNYTIEIEGVG